MTKKKKPTSSKQGLNSVLPTGDSKKAKKTAPGDPSDQDVKGRMGHFHAAGDPSLQLFGTRGKNRKSKKS